MLVIGGGVVGLITALTLAQAGIDVEVIEKLAETPDEPRACGYHPPVRLYLDKIGIYNLIREEGFMVRGLLWRTQGRRPGRQEVRRHHC